MSLDPNWKTILRRAWSVWLMLLAVVLTAAEIAVPLVLPDMFPPLTFAVLSGIATVAALIARVLVQKDLSDGF